MTGLDDLWPSLTGAIYDLRVPLLVATVLAAVVIGWVAWRRGALGAARRHPVRTFMVIIAVLVIGTPATWYLASPLIIRTELVELAPVAAVPIAASAQPDVAAPTAAIGRTSAEPSMPTTPPAQATQTPAPPAPSATPFAPITLSRGPFHGSDDFHFGRGTASIIKIAPDRFHLRLDDFSVRNGPDLFVFLSPSADGYAKGALELGRLKATDGAFGYDLPPGTDPADFASAVIWCKQFSHLFATAPLAAS